MRILIDFQGGQPRESRSRGIGRYSLALTRAIARLAVNHDLFIGLNGLFTDSLLQVRQELNGLVPQRNIHVWYTPSPVNSLSANNDWRRQSAELTREAFLGSLKPDVVLITSLFDGLGNDAVTSIGRLSRQWRTAVVLYDIIPYIYRQHYLHDPIVESWYERKLDELRRADHLLAISESSRRDVMSYLGLTPNIVTNISTASDSAFRPIDIAPSEEADCRLRYDLSGPFVMYTGGADPRKNIEGLIRAYAKLPPSVRESHQLAIVGDMSSYGYKSLIRMSRARGLSAREVVFTGYVPEDDLVRLYNLCKLFVFPSWHEGFGLPALEAMSCGRAVIGSNVSSLPEVIGRSDALFEPDSDDSIAEKLLEVLTDRDFRLKLERHSLQQANNFSWHESASRVIAACEALIESSARAPVYFQSAGPRPKMAYLSPLPPERSGISDYSASLLPELSRYYEIDVVSTQRTVTDPWIKSNCHVRSIDWFRANAGCYDRILYHLGNSSFHEHMLELIEEIPGIVVLHEFFLSGLIAYMDMVQGSRQRLTTALYESHGYKALNDHFDDELSFSALWTYPCNRKVLQNARGIIVHSQHLYRLAEKWYGTASEELVNWVVAPLARSVPPGPTRTDARSALGIHEDELLICSFGILGPSKLNHRLLRAWLTSNLSANPQCRLVFVGDDQGSEYGARLRQEIKSHVIMDRVHITGWADAPSYRHYLAAADMSVQLRSLSRGEVSAAVLDCMARGLPTIVNANGSLADLDNEVVWKLPDDFGTQVLVDALEYLASDSELRARIGERAREYVALHHAPHRCADKYKEAMERFYASPPPDMYTLARAIHKIEPGPHDPGEWISLAECFARSIRPPLFDSQLLVDITGLIEQQAEPTEANSAVRLLRDLLLHPPKSLRVEPVYCRDGSQYHYAREFTLSVLGCPTDTIDDDPVEYFSGDVFLSLDTHFRFIATKRAVYFDMRCGGVSIHFIVSDIPTWPFTTHGRDAGKETRLWLEVLAESDGILCANESVARQLAALFESANLAVGHACEVRSFSTGLPHTGTELVHTMRFA